MELAKDYIFQTMVSKVEAGNGRDRARTVTSFHVRNEYRRNSVNSPIIAETQRERASSSAAANDQKLMQLKSLKDRL